MPEECVFILLDADLRVLVVMGRVNYSGLVVAGIGFFLTRFTVTLAFEDPVRFYLAGVVPQLSR